ncbi:MAG: hypothetical protein ACPGYV_12365 [Phycisphaeraceae bacterium]
MLSIHAIDRALEAKAFDRLLSDLGRNGLVMPLPLRVQLAESAAGARGLGLRRLIELTYGPTALTRQVIASLIRAQSPTGAVLDAAGRPSCLLTAAFASGLGRALRDHGDRLGVDLTEVQPAYDRALGCLASMQAPDSLFAGPEDRALRDRLLTSAFIAYLLMDSPGFASVCRGHTLLTSLENQLEQAGPDAEQLIDMARLTRLVPAEPIPSARAEADRTSSGEANAVPSRDTRLLSAA